MNTKYPISFTAATFIILLTSLILANSKPTWVLEVSPILIGFPILFFTYRKFRFTDLVYVLLIIHFIILAVGSIYTYAEVPLGFWMQDWFGFSRNNYDKIGHFAQGFIPALLARELLIRASPLRPGKWLFFIVLCVCLAISAFYEIFEWWAAVILGASAEEFLGTQGYEWDAQSDMLLALIGAACALLLLSRCQDRAIARLP
jgi:putative membrane protein